jgi:hypothetical protein
MRYSKWMVLALLAWSGPLLAVLRIEPAAPTEGQPVRIALTRQYFSETFVRQESITRQGNKFTITQVVGQACFLPSAPTLTSTFDVGPLPRGTYQVVSTTTIDPALPGCPPSPAIVESTTFVVGLPVLVPSTGAWALFILALALVLACLARKGAITGSEQVNPT